MRSIGRVARTQRILDNEAEYVEPSDISKPRGSGTPRRTEPMRLFALEHSRRAYHADFALYGSAVLALAALVVGVAPHARWLSTVALTLAGLVGWSAIEYAMHRFVLHGVQPFRAWHEAHHDKAAPRCYGVTSAFWDHVFRSALICRARQG